ncbi:STN domain-containing protein [Hymenobacter cheonanensis]|uniref:STN domain-containing protein n=1 Tax=Hymenobacter sp. CA2-7 TaxID=3063993 RepID=UPI002713F7AB|nr:STN domain-containing protein [Hymenobacter sp. CA2-7]MDO7884841.1 STN domain-containing protein [Hymenobacter sp. CA2-7]
MLSTRLIACLVALAQVVVASSAASGFVGAQRPAQGPPANALIKMGRCDMEVVYNLPAQRFDETARAIAHATGCYIRYTDKKLVNVPVQPVRGRLTRRQALRVALRGTSLRIVRETPNLMEVKLASTH